MNRQKTQEVVSYGGIRFKKNDRTGILYRAMIIALALPVLIGSFSLPAFAAEAPQVDVIAYSMGTCVPLTAENDYSVLGDYKQSQSLLDRLKKIIEDYRRIFSLLIQMIRN